MSNFRPRHRPQVAFPITPCQRWRGALACLCAAAAFIPAVRALDPAKSIFQFNCHNWTREAGLPADKITTVTQTPDGYIWLGSQNGLVRFDGLEFKVVPVGLPQAQGQDIRQLDLAADGRMWFSIANGGYGNFDGETFSAIGDPRWTAPGMNSTTIRAGRDGAIWTGSVFGWGRWMPGKPEQTFFDEKLGSALVFAEDASARIWMGTAERGLFHWAGGNFLLFPDEELKKENIHAVAVDAGGDIWVGTGRGLRRYDAQFRLKKIYFPSSQTKALLLDRHGVLWAGTNQLGLARYKNDGFSFLRKADGLGSDDITLLFEDREGSLWMGTTDGLSQLSDLKFPIYSTKEGLIPGVALTVAASHKGGLWISTSNGASYFDSKTFRNYSDDSLLPNHYVLRVFEARNGDVYLVDGDKNINVLAGGRLAIRYANNSWPEAFAEDAAGVIGGIGPNLVRFHDGKIQPFTFLGQTPHLDWVNNLCVAKDGALWVATNNGLFRIEDGKFQHWSAADGLSADRIHYVLEDVDGSIWAGLPTGMVRIKDHRIKNITEEDGLPDDRIYAIVPGDRGFFWVTSGNGIFRVSRENLNAFADGKSARVQCEVFDGLESVKFADRTEQGFSGAKTLDGRIWFPNLRGVVMIDPANFFTNQIAPQVHVEEVLVDGRELKGKGAAILQVGARRVEFFFTALSYIAPKKTQVRYLLEGFDPQWIDAGAHRSVTYNNLPAGRYAFRVQAANADGRWNTVGDNFSIELPPPFYARFWFYALCGLAGVLILVVGYRWQVRQLHDRQQKLQVENDRLELKVGDRTGELARSLSLLNATIESVTDGIVAVDLSGKITFYNTKFVDLWQFPAGLLEQRDAGKTRAYSATLLKDPGKFLRELTPRSIGPEGKTFDVFELKDGRVFERYIFPQRVGDERVGVVVNWRDVTERRRAEEAVRESEERFSGAFEYAPIGVALVSPEGRWLKVNRALCDLVGYSSAELLTRTFQDITHPDDLEVDLAHVRRMIAGEIASYQIEKRYLHARGHPVTVLLNVSLVRDASGQPRYFISQIQDITARKQAENALRESNEKFHQLADNITDVFWIRSPDMRQVHYISPAFEQIWGRSVESLLANPQHWADFILPEDRERVLGAFASLTGHVPSLEIEYRIVRPDGEVRWIRVRGFQVRDAAHKLIRHIGIVSDITAWKESEAKLTDTHRQLLDTSRQAGMAEVATGVLHNVGNVLNSVNVSATLVADQVRHTKALNVAKLAALFAQNKTNLAEFLTQDARGQMIPDYLGTLADMLAEEHRSMMLELDNLRKNVEHIKDIVAMQQAYATTSGVIETVSVPDMIEEALRINAGSLVRHNVDTIRDYRARGVVTTDKHKVMQILINLVRNAKYACSESGLAAKQITVRTTSDEHGVKIAVIDNGIGIPAENLTRIFNHGFTTRKDGHGFGLHSGALAARELGGALTVQSDGPGYGATFVLELPAAPPPAASIP